MTTPTLIITPRRAERQGSPRARRLPATPADRQRLAYEGGRYLSVFGVLLLLFGLALAGVLAATLTPGSSALFVLVRKATPDKVLAELQGTGGTVLKTSLSSDDEAKLQEALSSGTP
jgi:hypothetical protein